MCGVNLTAIGEMRRRRESHKGSTTESQARLLSGIVYNDDKHTHEFVSLPKWVSSQLIDSVTTDYFDMKVVQAQAGPFGIYGIVS